MTIVSVEVERLILLSVVSDSPSYTRGGALTSKDGSFDLILGGLSEPGPSWVTEVVQGSVWSTLERYDC